VHVLLDRALGDPELMGDAGVRAALRHEREHFPLARREVLERILNAAGGDELLDEGRIDDRCAVDDPLEGLGELVDVRDAALQQVAAPLAAREQVGRLLDLDMRGEHENRRLGQLFADLAGGVEALDRMGGRHTDVDDGEVGPVLPNELDQVRRVARLAHDLEARALEQAGQALAEEDVVVGEHHSGPGRVHARDYGLP
jgi:hypothetical protein